MRTTTIQIARLLHDALPPGDLARVVEALEGYLIANDPEAGAPNPTVARRTDVAGDLIDRIEALVHETDHEAEVAEKRAGWSTTP